MNRIRNKNTCYFCGKKSRRKFNTWGWCNRIECLQMSISCKLLKKNGKFIYNLFKKKYV